MAPIINNNIETAAAAASATASMPGSSTGTLPTSAETTAEIVPSAQSARVEAVGPVTNPAPASPGKPEAGAQTTAAAATSPVESVKPTIVTKVNTSKPAAKNNTSIKTANTPDSNQHRTSGRGDDSFTIRGTNGGQLTKIISRPEVKSILAEYGLN